MWTVNVHMVMIFLFHCIRVVPFLQVNQGCTEGQVHSASTLYANTTY